MTTRRVRGWLTSWYAAALALGWLTLFVQTDTAAKLQGTIAPVVTTFQIDHIEPTVIGGEIPASRLSGTAVKLRDCTYTDVQWYLTDDTGRRTPVKAFFLEPPRVNAPGVIRWEALIVGVIPEAIPQTNAVVRHDCSNWPVISQYFDGSALLGD